MNEAALTPEVREISRAENQPLVGESAKQELPDLPSMWADITDAKKAIVKAENRMDKQEGLILLGYLITLLMVVGLFFQVQLMTNEVNNTKEAKFEELSNKIENLNNLLGDE